ncbi:conserved hypothetical protein [Coccidioides posadasii str. Silveira]|uniref:Uncharacterized protein n=1 Tax=Coccidioides posadasii (strain RMSCC 757 / Silveira) TaxID=443226 RepID=E9D6L5_COCPS|nr:conserved hypothetical protein [Coccidioides posadasii str. Silveira]
MDESASVEQQGRGDEASIVATNAAADWPCGIESGSKNGQAQGPVITVRRFARVTPGSEPMAGTDGRPMRAGEWSISFTIQGVTGEIFATHGTEWRTCRGQPFPSFPSFHPAAWRTRGKSWWGEPMLRLPGTAVRPPQSHVVEVLEGEYKVEWFLSTGSQKLPSQPNPGPAKSRRYPVDSTRKGK